MLAMHQYFAGCASLQMNIRQLRGCNLIFACEGFIPLLDLDLYPP